MTIMQAYAQVLEQGNEVTFAHTGDALGPNIRAGEKVTVSPVDHSKEIVPTDFVFVKVNGNTKLRRVWATSPEDGFLVGTNKNVNGWTKEIFGVVTNISVR